MKAIFPTEGELKHQTINAHINELNRWRTSRQTKGLDVRVLDNAILLAKELLQAKGYARKGNQVIRLPALEAELLDVTRERDTLVSWLQQTEGIAAELKAAQQDIKNFRALSKFQSGWEDPDVLIVRLQQENADLRREVEAAQSGIDNWKAQAIFNANAVQQADATNADLRARLGAAEGAISPL